MKIKFSPVEYSIPLTQLHVDKDVLTINGIELDFSPLLVGDVLPISAINESCGIMDIVTRDTDGHIVVTVRLPHGQNAPKETLFPDAYDTPIVITSGDVPVPPYSAPVEENIE